MRSVIALPRARARSIRRSRRRRPIGPPEIWALGVMVSVPPTTVFMVLSPSSWVVPFPAALVVFVTAVAVWLMDR